MPNAIYLDPTAGNPGSIAIGNVCYTRVSPSSAAPDTTDFDSSYSGCDSCIVPCICPEGLADCYTVTATPVGGGSPTVFNVTGTPCNWVQPAPVFGISQELTLVDAGGGNPCGWQFSWATGFATYYLTKFTGSDPTGDYPGSAGGFTISISACP
jgi:hypothetical protein